MVAVVECKKRDKDGVEINEKRSITDAVIS